MNAPQEPPVTLLPTGFIDLLQHEAEAEAQGIARIMDVFSQYGYEQVRPPLIEFEASLLAGGGQALSAQTFRIMDPDSRRMLALRPDMTTQISRIAATRLAERPRPLRLSYAGSCVLVGTPGRDGARQITQVGLELIGPDSAQADAEVILVTSSALSALKVANVSIDLSCPNIAKALIATETFTAAQEATLIQALDRKDVAAVRDLGGALAPVLTQLLRATGPARHALEILTQLELPPSAADEVTRLQEVVNAVWAADPAITLTIDPTEFRGWQYHTGLCMTVFAADVREEIGRGGRYLSYEQEAACGMTLRPEALLKATPPVTLKKRVYLPHGTSAARSHKLREDGFATVAGLNDVSDPCAEARRLRCAYYDLQDKLVEV